MYWAGDTRLADPCELQPLTSKKHEWTPERRRALSCLLVSLLLFSWPSSSFRLIPRFRSAAFVLSLALVFFYLIVSLFLCLLSVPSFKLFSPFFFLYFAGLTVKRPGQLLSLCLFRFNGLSRSFAGDQVRRTGDRTSCTTCSSYRFEVRFLYSPCAPIRREAHDYFSDRLSHSAFLG